MLDLDYKVGGRDSIFLVGAGLDGNLFKKIHDKVKTITHKTNQIIGRTSLPDRVYEKLSDWESKHRMEIKMLGGVIVAVVAAYFIGPAAGQLIGNIGGSTLAAMAAEEVVIDYVNDEIKKKLSRDQIAQFKRKFEKMTAEQVFVDPELSEISQKIAAEMGASFGFEGSFIRGNEICWWEYETKFYTPGYEPIKYSEYVAPPVKLIGPKQYLDAVDQPKEFTVKTMKCQPISEYFNESAAILAAEGAIEMEHQISKIASPSNQPSVLKKPINPIIPIGLAAAIGLLLL